MSQRMLIEDIEKLDSVTDINTDLISAIKTKHEKRKHFNVT